MPPSKSVEPLCEYCLRFLKECDHSAMPFLGCPEFKLDAAMKEALEEE